MQGLPFEMRGESSPLSVRPSLGVASGCRAAGLAAAWTLSLDKFGGPFEALADSTGLSVIPGLAESPRVPPPW